MEMGPEGPVFRMRGIAVEASALGELEGPARLALAARFALD
jgi:hypothetical protein